MGLSIFTYVFSLFSYIGHFLYSVFTGFFSSMFGLIDDAFTTVFAKYALDLEGFGVWAPIVMIISLSVGVILAYAVLEAGKIIGDME